MLIVNTIPVYGNAAIHKRKALVKTDQKRLTQLRRLPDIGFKLGYKLKCVTVDFITWLLAKCSADVQQLNCFNVAAMTPTAGTSAKRRTNLVFV